MRSHRARVASATNTLRRALVQRCHNHFHATQCAPHVYVAPTSASLRVQGVRGRVQGDTAAYELEDDEDDEGTLEQDDEDDHGGAQGAPPRAEAEGGAAA